MPSNIREIVANVPISNSFTTNKIYDLILDNQTKYHIIIILPIFKVDGLKPKAAPNLHTIQCC